METKIKTIDISKLRIHHYLEEKYRSNCDDTLKVSFLRTGNRPVYPIVVVPDPENPELFWVISGMLRLETLIQMEVSEVDVIVYDTTDETEI